MYELISYLSIKKAPGNINSSGPPSKKDLLKNLMIQYEELINFLKVNGAHLNTVRPEYLLSLSDYQKFVKIHPTSAEMKPRMFSYISLESWITIFYQILKIYYLNRVTPKSFKALPGIPSNEAGID